MPDYDPASEFIESIKALEKATSAAGASDSQTREVESEMGRLERAVDQSKQAYESASNNGSLAAREAALRNLRKAEAEAARHQESLWAKRERANRDNTAANGDVVRMKRRAGACLRDLTTQSQLMVQDLVVIQETLAMLDGWVPTFEFRRKSQERTAAGYNSSKVQLAADYAGAISKVETIGFVIKLVSAAIRGTADLLKDGGKKTGMELLKVIFKRTRGGIRKYMIGKFMGDRRSGNEPDDLPFELEAFSPDEIDTYAKTELKQEADRMYIEPDVRASFWRKLGSKLTRAGYQEAQDQLVACERGELYHRAWARLLELGLEKAKEARSGWSRKKTATQYDLDELRLLLLYYNRLAASAGVVQ